MGGAFAMLIKHLLSLPLCIYTFFFMFFIFIILIFIFSLLLMSFIEEATCTYFQSLICINISGRSNGRHERYRIFLCCRIYIQIFIMFVIHSFFIFIRSNES